MDHDAAMVVDELVARLCESRGGDVTVLCGAGISLAAPSSLPTVATFTSALVKAAGGSGEMRERVLKAARASNPPPRFEVLLDELGVLTRGPLNLEYLFEAERSNDVHRFLAWRLSLGDTVVTTNFDTCVERVAGHSLTRAVFQGHDLAFAPVMRGALLKPHGSNPCSADDQGERALVATVRALSRTARGFALYPIWRASLEAAFADRVVVVYGYSGSDDFDITPILEGVQPARLLWIDYAPTPSGLAAGDLDAASPAVRRICGVDGGVYLRGNLSPVLAATRHLWSEGTREDEDPHVDAALRVASWVAHTFPDTRARAAALNALLLHHQLYAEVAALPHDAADPEARVQRSRALHYLGSYVESSIEARLALGLDPTIRQRAHAEFMNSSSLAYAGELLEAVEAAERHIAVAIEARDAFELQTALTHRGALAFMLNDYEGAESHYRRSLALQSDHPSLQASVLASWGLGDLQVIRGYVSEAARTYVEAQVIAEQLGSRSGVAWLEANIGEAVAASGASPAALRHFERALEWFDGLAIPSGTLFCLAGLAKVELRIGAVDAAMRRLELALPLLARGVGTVAVADFVLLAYLLEVGHGGYGFVTPIVEAVRQKFPNALPTVREVTMDEVTRSELARLIVDGKGFTKDVLLGACLTALDI